jgi:hypothetical protein
LLLGRLCRIVDELRIATGSGLLSAAQGIESAPCRQPVEKRSPVIHRRALASRDRLGKDIRKQSSASF